MAALLEASAIHCKLATAAAAASLCAELDLVLKEHVLLLVAPNDPEEEPLILAAAAPALSVFMTGGLKGPAGR